MRTQDTSQAGMAPSPTRRCHATLRLSRNRSSWRRQVSSGVGQIRGAANSYKRAFDDCQGKHQSTGDPFAELEQAKRGPAVPMPRLLDAPAPAACLLALLQLGHVPDGWSAEQGGWVRNCTPVDAQGVVQAGPPRPTPHTPRCCIQQASPGDLPQRQVQQGIAQRLQVVPRPRPLAL